MVQNKRKTYRKNNAATSNHTTVDKNTTGDFTAEADQTITYDYQRLAASTVSTDNTAASASLNCCDRPLAFTLKNMTDLVTAYESYRKLEQSISLITGTIPDNAILNGLHHIDEILLCISPVFNDIEDDAEYDKFIAILDDPVIGAREKAMILMGTAPVPVSSAAFHS